jgi:hypothetical protein
MADPANAAQKNDDELSAGSTLEERRQQMLSNLEDFKAWEAHDLKSDMVVTAVDNDLAPLIAAVKERITHLKPEEFSIKPAIEFGFTEESLIEKFLRWSQKEDDVPLHQYNIDKATRWVNE